MGRVEFGLLGHYNKYKNLRLKPLTWVVTV